THRQAVRHFNLRNQELEDHDQDFGTSLQHPETSIKHQASSIQHPASRNFVLFVAMAGLAARDKGVNWAGKLSVQFLLEAT
ncbi:MAG: hypothetical protein J4F48_08950, partial [Nitrospinae bacterium]|nr:hypothetical protein [Nitrospinota bacterium]